MAAALQRGIPSQGRSDHAPPAVGRPYSELLLRLKKKMTKKKKKKKKKKRLFHQYWRLVYRMFASSVPLWWLMFSLELHLGSFAPHIPRESNSKLSRYGKGHPFCTKNL
jgi:hypothetical protein